jgi:hypothetical protein
MLSHTYAYRSMYSVALDEFRVIVSSQYFE